jgi:hypothetical protein
MGQIAVCVFGMYETPCQVIIESPGMWIPFILRQEGIQAAIPTVPLPTYLTLHFSAVWASNGHYLLRTKSIFLQSPPSPAVSPATLPHSTHPAYRAQ